MRHFKQCAFLSLAAALAAGPAVAQVDLDQRIFRFDRPALSAGELSTYDPQNAGYARLTVERFRQEANGALCFARAPDSNSRRRSLAIQADRFAGDLWRRFMGANTSTGTAVRLFTGAETETAPDNQALAVINLTQITIPPNRNNCRPVTQNGAVNSPLLPLHDGTPTFAVRVNRWHDNTLDAAAVGNLEKTGSWLGTAAGLPVPIAGALSNLAVSNFRAEAEAAMGNTAGEMFNARRANGGQIVRVFTGYTLPMERRPTGPAPGWTWNQESRPRAYRSADTEYPYADIYLTTVASIFDPDSANFAQASASDRVQGVVERTDILKYQIPDAPAAFDTLEEILARPELESQRLAVSRYRDAQDLATLSLRCNDLFEALESSELGLSPQDTAVVLLSLARHHRVFGEKGTAEADRGRAAAQACVQRNASRVEILGVTMPPAVEARPETVAVGPVDRAAMSELLNSVAGSETAQTAVSLLGGSTGSILVRDESLLLDGFRDEEQISLADFARRFRLSFSEARCGLPSAADPTDSRNEPFQPRSDDPNARTMLTLLRPENGSPPIIGVFYFDPRAAGAPPRFSAVEFRPLSEGLAAKVRESYSTCSLLAPLPPPPPPLPPG
jgi:hypothetical protein